MAPRSGIWRILALLVPALTCCLAADTTLADHFVYETPDGRQSVEGQLVARTDAEILFVSRDGRMHLVASNRAVQLQEGDKPQPFTKEEMIGQLRREFGGGFRIFHTNHYVVCYNCDSDFARSCGSLFERLHRAFTNYFLKAGFEVKASEYPLVAVVFGEERDFLTYASRELGEDMARNVIGYYSFLTNRMVLYDMQAHAAHHGLGNVGRKVPPAQRGIHSLAAANIATVVHEATHQLAYNCGFHQRFSDNPLWVAEGMAMFVEAPDAAALNWTRIGEINKPRLDLFRKRHFGSNAVPVEIGPLIKSDDLLRGKDTALEAYSDAWALTFFLIRTHREQFFQYLKSLAKKRPLDQDTPEQRLADFQAIFGELQPLQDEFVRYMRALPAR
jgi:hypothetical protein